MYVTIPSRPSERSLNVFVNFVPTRLGGPSPPPRVATPPRGTRSGTGPGWRGSNYLPGAPKAPGKQGGREVPPGHRPRGAVRRAPRTWVSARGPIAERDPPPGSPLVRGGEEGGLASPTGRGERGIRCHRRRPPVSAVAENRDLIDLAPGATDQVRRSRGLSLRPESRGDRYPEAGPPCEKTARRPGAQTGVPGQRGLHPGGRPGSTHVG